MQLLFFFFVNTELQMSEKDCKKKNQKKTKSDWLQQTSLYLLF